MKRRVLPFVILVVIAGVFAIGVWGANHVAHAQQRSCERRVQTDDAKVHTDHPQEFADKVPGLGDYVEIHWERQAQNNPCARNTYSTEWEYQAVVRLRPADAAALANAYSWQSMQATVVPETYPFNAPEQMWPGLVPSAPADPRWLYNEAYNDTYFQHSKSGDLYLDPATGFAFFTLLDD